MTRIFARVIDSIVMEIVPPLPLTQGWEEIIPEDGDVRTLYAYPEDAWIEITEENSKIDQNWVYQDGKFSAPLEVIKSLEQIELENKSIQDSLLKKASEEITPLLMILQLGSATKEEILLANKWQDYYRFVKEVDIKSPDINWPEIPK